MGTGGTGRGIQQHLNDISSLHSQPQYQGYSNSVFDVGELIREQIPALQKPCRNLAESLQECVVLVGRREGRGRERESIS